jgi:hypothetical protein
VSQKIAQEHGGRITVESQPGKGSHFVIQIPAILANADSVNETIERNLSDGTSLHKLGTSGGQT